ncbi:hypothetical protein AMJ80_04455 [bacterium SM23_31]|nr:MAG: hypothetical protein AMJ80_04455 [bacterium SM23_31]
MENLRAAIESDLHESLEGEWKMPVELINPDGENQIYSKNDPSELLGGQVLYFSRREDPETGETIVVDQPVVTLRISSLIRVPQAGENWYIKMPVSPVEGALKERFVFTPTRSPEHGTDIGFIRIYPQRTEETEVPVS